LGELDLAMCDAASFGRSFVGSEAFKALFREGMDLVEETAAYLDGPGRRDESGLRPGAAKAYSAETMRLTNRLMQITSWLLVQRAVADGDIGPNQARQERARLRAAAKTTVPIDLQGFDELPEGLQALVGLSARLHARILHIDLLLDEEAPAAATPDNPVAAQQTLIARAFSVKAP
jgi:regulator of CtrA degradation